jgi:hypothetical protein
MRDVGPYLNCPRCGLSIRVRLPWLAMTHCPRCIARAHTAVELFGSDVSASIVYANGSLPVAGTFTAPMTRPGPTGGLR